MAATLELKAKSNSGEILLARAERYLRRHPELTRTQLLKVALQHELAARERIDEPTLPATPEEIQNHLWLEEQFESLRPAQPGLLNRIRSFFAR